MINIKIRHFFYPSNLLSILRLLLVIPVWIFLSEKSSTANILLLVTVAVAIISDWLDGYLARLLDQKTELGKILDPLADKVLMVAGLAGFVVYREFPLLLVLILGYRDLVILIGGIYLSGKIKGVPEALFWGKANTCVVSITGFVFLLLPDWIGTQVLIYLSYLSIAISGVDYLLFACRTVNLRKSMQSIVILLLLIPALILVYLFQN